LTVNAGNAAFGDEGGPRRPAGVALSRVLPQARSITDNLRGSIRALTMHSVTRCLRVRWTTRQIWNRFRR